MPTAIAALIGLGDSSAGHLAPDEEFVMVGDYQAIDFWKPRRALKGVRRRPAATLRGSVVSRRRNVGLARRQGYPRGVSSP